MSKKNTFWHQKDIKVKNTPALKKKLPFLNFYHDQEKLILTRNLSCRN